MKQQITVLLIIVFITGCKVDNKKPEGQTIPKNEKQREQNTPGQKQQETSNKQKTTSLPESYREYPQKTKAENDRYVDSNNILHVDLLGNNIPVSEGKAMITEMYPGCKVSYNKASTNYFDVFDIDCQGQPFTAIVSYERNMDNENIIAFIYIQDEKYSIKMIENLFED